MVNEVTFHHTTSTTGTETNYTGSVGETSCHKRYLGRSKGYEPKKNLLTLIPSFDVMDVTKSVSHHNLKTTLYLNFNVYLYDRFRLLTKGQTT